MLKERSFNLTRHFKEHMRSSVACIVVSLLMLLYLVLQVTQHPEPMTNAGFRQTVWLIGVVLIVLFILSYVMIAYYHIRKHILALVLLPVLGVIYMVVIPIGAVPDESTHVATSYRISNQLLGIGETGLGSREIIMRADDASYRFAISDLEDDFSGFSNLPMNRDQYTDYWGRFGTPLSDGTLVTTELSSGQHILTPDRFPPHQYFTPALGLTVGRLTGLGTYDTYLLARIFSLVMSVLVTVWAIYLLPVRKTLLMVIALLPITLQHSMAISYDPFTNRVAFLIIAITMYLLYNTPDDKRIRLAYFILLCALSLLLAFAKQKAYALFLVFPLYILYRYDYIKKKYLKYCLIAALVLVCFVVMRFFAGRMALNDAESAGAFFPDFAGRMLERLYHFYTGFTDRMGYLFLDIGGQRMASLRIGLSSTAFAFSLPLLTLASIKTKNEPACITRSDRCVMLPQLFVSMSGVFLAIQSGYGWYQRDYYVDVQGRYLIPVLLPALLCASTDLIEMDESIDNLLIPASVCLNFFGIMYLLAYVPA